MLDDECKCDLNIATAKIQTVLFTLMDYQQFINQNLAQHIGKSTQDTHMCVYVCIFSRLNSTQIDFILICN